MNEATNMMRLLHTFERASGQKVNVMKSSAFFSTNVISSNKEEIGRVIQMQEVNDGSKYRGLPNILGRNKSVVLGYLKDKVLNRIRSWDSQYIAKSGKEILIKYVAQTLPSFAMSAFLLPLEITKEIERTLSKYWWGSKLNQRSGIHWQSWSNLSKHKTAGGMGFRDFRDFDIAMLGKQGWYFLTNPGSMVSRLFQAKYFPKCNLLDAKVGNNPSYVWRSIWEAKSLFKYEAR